MRRLTKPLRLLSTLFLAATLVACGASDNADNSADDNVTGESTTAEANVEATSDEAAQADFMRALEGEGIVNAFIGEEFYDGKVTDEESAEACVMSVIDRIGGDETTELEPNSVRPNEEGMTVVTFTQQVGGVLVYGSTVKLVLDNEGTPIALVSSIMPDVTIPPIEEWAIGQEQAEQIVMDQLAAQGADGTLVEGASERAIIGMPGLQERYGCVWVVYTYQPGDEDSHQVYMANYVTAEGEYLYSMPVSEPGDSDALTGQSAKALFDFDAYEPDEMSVTIERPTGTTEEITVPVLRDAATGKVYLADAKRKILCADYASYEYGQEMRPIEVQDGADPIDASALNCFIRVWDYFDSVGWTGPDGDGTPSLLLMNFVEQDGTPIDNAAYESKKDGFQVFNWTHEFDYGACTDIIAHEFAHCLTATTMTTSLYKDDIGAINEGFSDVMGNLVEMRLDGEEGAWTLGEALGPEGIVRNMADPHQYAQPEFAWDAYYAPKPPVVSGINDRGGVHTNSSLLNTVSYRLHQAGMPVRDQAYYWMNVALVLSPQTDYPMLSEILPWVMKQVGYAEYIDTLKAAIDEAKFTVTEDLGTIAEGCGSVTFDFAPIQEAADMGIVSIGFYRAPDANPLMRAETWPVAGETVARANLLAGDYYVVAAVGDESGLLRRVMVLSEDGWTFIGNTHKDPEAIKAAGTIVTVEAGETLEIPNDTFGSVATEQLEEIGRALEEMYEAA